MKATSTPMASSEDSRKDESVVFPCPIIVDTREQSPFEFAGITADSKQGYRPIIVEVVRGCLGSGDYSLQGMEQRIAIERKGLEDLFGTLGRGRGRFQRELIRLSEYDFAAVVVEADWNAIITAPPEHSKLSPKTIFRSCIAWQIRYPQIHWWLCPGRRFAELATFRILERFWKVNGSK